MSEVVALLARSPGKPGDLTSVLQHIAQTVQDAFAADACVILAFNPITSRLIGSQTAGNLQVEDYVLHNKLKPEGITQQILRDDVVLIEDLEVKPQYHNQFTHKEGVRGFAGLALYTRDRKRSLGVIYLGFRQPRAFSLS